MNSYLLIKWIHIMSSVLMVGTGLGSAFYLFFANRSGSVAAQAVVSRLVVRADWWFTTPSMIIQPISGIALAYMAGWPLDAPWIVLAFVLYFFSGACWLPVVVIQIRMAKIAQQAAARQVALPGEYQHYQRYWEVLGYPAFIAMLGVYYLMIVKPPLWGG